MAGQREIHQRCLDSDGWFDTGDLARRGGIRITGRRDDLIIRRWGTKVPTLEVEAVLLRVGYRLAGAGPTSAGGRA